MRIIAYIFLILIIILGVSFACLNAAPVSVHYYIGEHTLPLSLLMVCVFGCGALLGILSSIIPLLRLKTENFRLRKRVKAAEKEVSNLRTSPLKDDQ